MPSEAEPRTLGATNGTPCSILLVEDEPDIRASLKDALELEGYHVVAAPNGREALDRLPQMPRPCLILLDLMMPVMDGWEFAEHLQADAAHAAIPIVVVTAFSQEAEKRRRIETRGVVPKPVNLDRLFGVVKRFCGSG
jgi:CheY-like chemotaxis protein